MSRFLLAIDQGTTSSRAIVFDESLSIRGVGQKEFPQHFPQSGWVEHDVADIWSSTLESIKDALCATGITLDDITAIGITNQRETAVVWDHATGEAIHKAIVWQDRRTADECVRLRASTNESDVTVRSGLLLDPYFSATKVAWLLDHVDGARARAEAGELIFGTIDSYLIWRLTSGKRHVTDATNASRTNLFNIAENQWDEALCDLFRVPMSMLPDVLDCVADFGVTDSDVIGAEVPILGVAGDQQAASVGQACFSAGMLKSTYGTGCFALLNTGDQLVYSNNKLLSTIAYRLDGEPTYALEGSIFVAGAAVQWLRDGLGLISDASQSGNLAQSADSGHHVYLVPAFVGLGAPYWDANARASLMGMTRNTGPSDLCRAALESVCYQTRDLLDAMTADWNGASGGETVLRVDGGMVASDWTMQFLADILDAPVDRPKINETTALGAAMLAGVGSGVFADLDHAAQVWQLERRFEPDMEASRRDTLYAGWKDAVSRTLTNT